MQIRLNESHVAIILQCHFHICSIAPKTLIVKACQEAVVYGWTPLCVFWMDDQGKDAYLNDGVKPTKRRFSAACTYIPPVHMHRYARAATG